MSATLSFVYPCLDHSPHTCCFYMSASPLTGVFGFASVLFCKSVHLIFSLIAFRLSWIEFPQHVVLTVIVSLRRDVGSLVHVICHFVSCCDLGLFSLCFCLDYYGMQLAAETLPVYCPHPGPGIITDITRLFTMWEPRWAIFTRSVKPSLNLWPHNSQLVFLTKWLNEGWRREGKHICSVFLHSSLPYSQCSCRYEHFLLLRISLDWLRLNNPF